MELFKVICVTCQAKLSVRNESLIGQIVACPRCDSMVEVTPPTATEPLVVPPPIHASEEVVSAAVSHEVSLPDAEAEGLPASAAVGKYKVMAWSLVGFFAGATLFGVVLYSRSDPKTEATGLEPSSRLMDPVPVAEDLPSSEEPLEVSPPIVKAPSVIVPEPVAPAPTIEKNIAAQPADESTEPPEPAPLAEDLPKTEPAPTPRVALHFDPLDYDPENLTLATIDQPAAPVESPTSEPHDAAVEISVEVPSTVPLVRRGPVVGEDASRRDAGKQLALLIPKVKIDQQPLVECLRLFSQISGVPVSVTPEQLLMAGITSRKSVSLDASDLSLAEMLKQVLNPLRLEYHIQGAQVVVVRQQAEKRREINYPLGDLVGAETNEEQFAAWVEQLVAPSTWQAAGGQGTLVTTPGSLRIGQTQQVQYQVLIMLERLRLARNLPPKSRYPVKRLTGTPANALLHEKLARPATFTFLQYTAIDEIFVHWQTEFGAPLLIDWPALAEAEVWPRTTIACAISEQPWSAALEKVLEPLGLGWRATLGGAIEITSAEKVQGELQLELYPLRNDLEGGVARLRKLAKQQADGVMLYDPVGKVFLVLEPAATQRLIFQWLHERESLLSE